MATYTVQISDIMKKWAQDNGTDMMDVPLASAWAVKSGLYTKAPISAEKQCAQDMRRALQRDTYTDPQGNEIHTMHAVKGYKGEQTTLFVDIRTAKPEIMEDVFNQNYERIANDVKRHAIEKQSYDFNNPYQTTLPLFDYNFNGHADEARISGEYDDSYNDEEGEEDLG